METGKDWPQILAIIVACVPGLSSSLILTWSSAYIPVLTENDIYNISEDEANILPIISTLGWFLAPIFFKIPDVIGRKYTLLLLNVPQALYWIIIMFARNIYWFYIARLTGGLADTIMYAVLPMYLGEVTTPRIRGTWGNGQTFSFNAGFFLMSAIGSYLSIEASAYIFLILPIISVLAFLWLPESPYYSIMKNDKATAKKSLKWLLNKDEVDKEFQQLTKDVQRQISETASWTDLIKIRSNRRALLACVFLRWAQQLAGIAIFETYFQFIFRKSGTTALSPRVSAMVFSGWLWIVMTGFSLTLDTFGRKKSFIFSSIGCALCLGVESIYFYLDEFAIIDISVITWFPITALMFYVVFYCFGLGLLPSLMAGELFSASIKAKALAIANVMLGLVCFIETYVFKTMTDSMGLYAPFAFFSVCTLFSFALSFFVVPETKGKSLEEIQQDLKKKRNK